MGRNNKRKKVKKRTSSPKNRFNGISKYDIGLYRINETKALQMPYGRLTLSAGDLVLCPHYLPIQKQFVKAIEQCFNEVKPGMDLNGKKVIVERYGGIGDILCSLPAIYELRKANPTVTIGYMCSHSYSNILYNFPQLIDGALNNIVLYDTVKHFTHFVSLEKLVERCDDPDKHIHDIYADALNQTVDLNSVAGVISLNKAANSTFQRTGIGVQYSTNAMVRDYDLEKFIEFINLFADAYPNEVIHLLGAPDDYLTVNYIQSRTDGRVLANGCGRNKMGFMESLDLVSTLKMVVAPDSSMIHFAGFTNTPMIGLYGPFASATRMSRYYHAIGIDGNTECGPCMRHMPTNWCKWNSGQGMCTNAIQPKEILEQANIIMGMYQ